MNRILKFLHIAFLQNTEIERSVLHSSVCIGVAFNVNAEMNPDQWNHKSLVIGEGGAQ